VYESDITKGLNVFRVTDSALAPDLTINQPFLNPQTQMEPQRCKGLPATHLGTNGRDKIRGTAEADVVVALGGKDSVNTRGGEDLVCAGGGKDRVKGKGGNDRLYGQGGSDRLNGGAAVDRCVGGPGRDRIRRCERGRP
jgi:Ca2+-binding RTX toxin-like protein